MRKTPTKLLQWKIPDNWYPKNYPTTDPEFYWNYFDNLICWQTEVATAIISGTVTYVAGVPDTLTWAGGLAVVSPMSGAVITVTGSGISVSAGDCLYIEVPTPFNTCSRELQKGGPDVARKVGNCPIGYVVSGGNAYIRPDKLI